MKLPVLKQDETIVSRSLTANYTKDSASVFLIPVRPDNVDQAIDEYENGSIRFPGLNIAGVSDLSFLNKLSNVRYLEINDTAKLDLSPVATMDRLCGLCIRAPYSGLDFSGLTKLEAFWGDWHPKNTGLSKCLNLHSITAWHFKPEEADLTPLEGLAKLQRMRLLQSNLTSLNGISSLEDLFRLEIAYAPKLVALDALKAKGLPLRELEFSKCKRIPDYTPISKLEFLRKLRLQDCPPMNDLQWTQGMNRLDFFSFVGTNVVNADLTPLLKLPKLRYAGSMAKRHYQPHIDELNEMLQASDR